MTSKKSELKQERIQKTMERLSENDLLLERIEDFLETAYSDKSAALDEIETKLIDLLREVGNESLAQWAASKEKAVHKELKSEYEQVQQREKKRSIFTPPSDASK
ncbi:MAG: hypothetical protein MK080_12335 [Opitutales bacterium]|nr:hypothetical protein [Opitutales bacterium]NRA26123.1 hypothetical protein [Opitutales bacterium]